MNFSFNFEKKKHLASVWVGLFIIKVEKVHQKAVRIVVNLHLKARDVQ